MSNSDNLPQKPENKQLTTPDRLLAFLEEDLDYKKQELAYRYKSLDSEKEIKIKSLEYGDKDSDRGFKAFELSNQRENSKFAFIRNIGYAILFTIIGLVIFSGFLISSEKSEGFEILKTILNVGLGILGGFGIKKLISSNKNNSSIE